MGRWTYPVCDAVLGKINVLGRQTSVATESKAAQLRLLRSSRGNSRICILV